jgi:hypothetical protein
MLQYCRISFGGSEEPSLAGNTSPENYTYFIEQDIGCRGQSYAAVRNLKDTGGNPAHGLAPTFSEEKTICSQRGIVVWQVKNIS